MKNKNDVRRPLTFVQYAETTPLYTLADLRRRYGQESSTRSIQNVLSRLKKQGRVRAVCHGVYAGTLASTSLDRYAVPANLRRDAVVALHSALEFHGLANQIFQTVYYFSTHPRRDVIYESVTYHRVAPPRRLVQSGRVDFQVDTAPTGIRVTSRERSLIDCLLLLQYSGGVEELDQSLSMFPSFNFEMALEYLNILGHSWLYSRLGYLLDRHREKLFFSDKWRDRFLKHLPKGVVYLGSKRSGGRWVPTWNLMVPPSLTHPSEEAQNT